MRGRMRSGDSNRFSGLRAGQQIGHGLKTADIAGPEEHYVEIAAEVWERWQKSNLV